jgi:hypothetical protein
MGGGGGKRWSPENRHPSHSFRILGRGRCTCVFLLPCLVNQLFAKQIINHKVHVRGHSTETDEHHPHFASFVVFYMASKQIARYARQKNLKDVCGCLLVREEIQ